MKPFVAKRGRVVVWERVVSLWHIQGATSIRSDYVLSTPSNLPLPPKLCFFCRLLQYLKSVFQTIMKIHKAKKSALSFDTETVHSMPLEGGLPLKWTPASVLLVLLHLQGSDVISFALTSKSREVNATGWGYGSRLHNSHDGQFDGSAHPNGERRQSQQGKRGEVNWTR